jgi:hypothetical protein
VQGRCVNCIRLKKECSFYPVDQQPPPDARSKAPSRASTGPKIASASSSPAIPTGHPSDLPPHQQYPPLAMPPIPNMAPPSMKPTGSEAFSPEAKSESLRKTTLKGHLAKEYCTVPLSASSAGRQFDFGGQQHMTTWMPADASPASATKPGDLNATWRSYPQESPLAPSPSTFSPYTPHAPPPSAGWNAPVSAEPAPREEVSWPSYPPPPRSMSFGAESMSNHSQQSYPTMSNRPYERKSASISSDMYPPPIATSVPGVESVQGGTTMEHNVSLSAGAVPPPHYGSWQQPSYSYPKPGETYGSWGYGENGGHAPVHADEQVPQPAESQPPQPNMYYPPR